MERTLQFFDTHAHNLYRYKNRPFYEQRHEILKKAYEAGVVKIVNVAIDMESNFEMLKEFATYPWESEKDGAISRSAAEESGLPRIGIAIGEHPLLAGADNGDITDQQKDEALWALCADKRVCAIKTGLDYSRGEETSKRQQKRFRRLIQLSREKGLPLVLHVRDAYEDALQILGEEADGHPYRGVIHCFTQGPKLATLFVDKGFCLGIGGKVTYEKNSELRETVTVIPLAHLVLETDCPLIPLHGNKKSSSLDIPAIAQTIAQLKGISLEQVAEETYQNGEKLFQ